ncbi:hypothetical protein NON00_03170, partial [Roseomonas sp. GC11]|nr:hypothetical protein [Roseomonas sp. GC11]
MGDHVSGQASGHVRGQVSQRGSQGWVGRGLLLALMPLGLPSILLLAGCVGSPAEGPRDFWNNAFGTPLQGRPLPPGAEQGYPNLAAVPPPPPRGAASEREALSAALAEARSQS